MIYSVNSANYPTTCRSDIHLCLRSSPHNLKEPKMTNRTNLSAKSGKVVVNQAKVLNTCNKRAEAAIKGPTGEKLKKKSRPKYLEDFFGGAF